MSAVTTATGISTAMLASESYAVSDNKSISRRVVELDGCASVVVVGDGSVVIGVDEVISGLKVVDVVVVVVGVAVSGVDFSVVVVLADTMAAGRRAAANRSCGIAPSSG